MALFRDFCDQNEHQISNLARKCGSYVLTIDEPQIRNWLKQFGEGNRFNLELGLKLLNQVDYFAPDRLVNESRYLHQTLLARENKDNQTLLRKPTYFVDFSPSSGHSQDELIPKYRMGSNLRENRFDNHFIYLRDIKEFLNRKNVTLVFLTDFIGSGKQVTDLWKDNLWAISPENEHILLSICGYDSGIRRIEEETDQLSVITNRTYTNRNRIFAEEQTLFNHEEKTILRGLCDRAGEDPTGFKNTQSLTVFYSRCPNNVISILRANNDNWVGLFKRYPD